MSTPATPAPPATPGAPLPPERVTAAAWSLLVFLTLLNVLNFVDRMLIAALAPLLIQDLGLSRAQIGLLAGFGFVFFYTLVGLGLGMAADRWRRIPLIAAGLTLWSAMTALSGWARNFVQLAIPRVFVGIGEATLTPAALSMLGDAFPASRLAMASGIYYAGIPLGTGVSMVASSWVAPRYGWRTCFFVLGALGLVAVLGLLAFREPARRKHLGGLAPPAPTPGATARPSLRRILFDLGRELARNRRLVLTLVGGSMLCYGAGAALHVVTWLVEERGYTYGQAAFRAGIVGMLAGFFGNLAGGAFGDWFARRRANGHLFSLIPMTLFFTPIGLVFFSLEPGTPLFHLCWFFTAAGTSAWFGPLFAAIQELAPGQSRATTVAFALLVLNLLGVGPGPLVTGIIGDRIGLTTGLLASLAVVALAIVPFALAARGGPTPAQPTPRPA